MQQRVVVIAHKREAAANDAHRVQLEVDCKVKNQKVSVKANHRHNVLERVVELKVAVHFTVTVNVGKHHFAAQRLENLAAKKVRSAWLSTE